jgi:type IV secretion system protein VirB9
MNPPIILSVACSLALTAATVAHAAGPHALQPNAPRTVVVNQAAAPPVIRTGLLQSTLITLPDEEKVASVFAGDTGNWIFDGGHVASRFISIKPKLAASTTDVHIISDHGNEYTLQLHEVSNEEDLHFDSKIFVVPGDQSAKDKLTELPVFVPASDMDKM